MRKIWFFIPLLISGCMGERYSINESDMISVGDKFFHGVKEGSRVTVYGYLVDTDQGSLMFSDKDISHIRATENYNFSLKLWYLEDRFDGGCFDGYVAVKGIKFNYAGAPSIDEVEYVYSLENEGHLCYSMNKPIRAAERVMTAD